MNGHSEKEKPVQDVAEQARQITQRTWQRIAVGTARALGGYTEDELETMAFTHPNELPAYVQEALDGESDIGVRVALAEFFKQRMGIQSAIALHATSRLEPFVHGEEVLNYFLLQTTDGRFIAANPANRHSFDYQSSNPSVIASPSLDETLTLIRGQAGGIWPHPEKIEDVLSNESFRFPREILDLSTGSLSLVAQSVRCTVVVDTTKQLQLPYRRKLAPNESAVDFLT